MIKEHIYKTPQVSLNYAEGPNNGPPLLLLPGGSARWQSFDVLISHFIERYHIFALDLRGHGKSGWVPNSYKLQDYVPDIASFVEHCIKESTIIFGHSLGGEIGIMAAAHHPLLVKALVVGDSPLSKKAIFEHLHKQSEMTQRWREWTQLGSIERIKNELKNMMIPVAPKNQLIKASEAFGEHHPWFESFAISLSQNDPDMLTSVFDDYENTFAQYDVEKLFPLIKCPVLILRGGVDKGSLITDDDISLALQLLLNAQETKIPHVGHALFMEDKDAVATEILEFTQNLEK